MSRNGSASDGRDLTPKGRFLLLISFSRIFAIPSGMDISTKLKETMRLLLIQLIETEGDPIESAELVLLKTWLDVLDEVNRNRTDRKKLRLIRNERLA